jgi:hypothetical protein
MFISILSTCFEGKILIAFTWLFQLDNKKAEMEGKEGYPPAFTPAGFSHLT